MNGCEIIKCSDFKDGVCHYDNPMCKYQTIDGDELGIYKNMSKEQLIAILLTEDNALKSEIERLRKCQDFWAEEHNQLVDLKTENEQMKAKCQELIVANEVPFEIMENELHAIQNMISQYNEFEEMFVESELPETASEIAEIFSELKTKHDGLADENKRLKCFQKFYLHIRRELDKMEVLDKNPNSMHKKVCCKICGKTFEEITGIPELITDW